MPPRKDKDATRSERKAKRRVLEDRIPDIPGDGDDENTPEQTEVEESTKNKRSRDKLEADDDTQNRAAKKARKNNDQPNEDKKQRRLQGEERIRDATEQDSVMKPHKSKKERKAERKALQAAAAAVDAEKSEISKAEEENLADTNAAPKVTKPTKGHEEVSKKRPAKACSNGGETEEGKEAKSGKPPRFIVFVGNLPFTATKASIEEHFVKVKPKDIRLLTEKGNPTKSRGIAFVEFEGYDKMKTCLKLMQHSEFDDGKSAPRKINVELTAGGGGKTKQRTAKIAEKNHKLQEERFRRVQAEDKLKAKKRGAGSTGNIHPSRLGRLGLD